MAKLTYTVSYRLDDIDDVDNTEYIDNISSKAKARIQANAIAKEYGDRVVLLDILGYDEDGYLEFAETII